MAGRMGNASFDFGNGRVPIHPSQLKEHYALGKSGSIPFGINHNRVVANISSS